MKAGFVLPGIVLAALAAIVVTQAPEPPVYNSEVGTTISDARFGQYWSWLTEGERSRFLRYARAAIEQINKENDRDQ